MNKLLVLLYFTTSYALSYGQDPPSTGLLIPDSTILNQIPYSVLPTMAFGTGIDGDFIIDGMPPIQSQGGIGSCVSWSTIYYLRSYILRNSNGYADYGSNGIIDKRKLMSPLYNHNQLIKCPGTIPCHKCPTSHYSALEFLRTNGAVSLELFPEVGNSNNAACSIQPNVSLYNEALKNRIQNYAVIVHPLRTYAYGAKYSAIKNAILNGHPVLIGIPVDNSFKNARNIRDYKWTSFVGDASKAENHSMLCVGFSDNRDAIYVINSWSESWGDRGFGWISKKVLERYMLEAYIVNAPANSLLSSKSISKENYGSQDAIEAISKRTLQINTPVISFFATNRYQEFDQLRIVPMRIRKTYGLIKFYQRDQNKLQIIDIPNLEKNQRYEFVSNENTYQFTMIDIRRLRLVGKRVVDFTLTRIK